MKREFWAEFDLVGALSDDQRQNRSILEGWFSTNGPSQERWSQISDPAARRQLLAQLLVTESECNRRTKCKDYAKEQLIKWYYADDLKHPRGDFQEFLCQRLRWMGSILGLTDYHNTLSPSLPDLSAFPSGSWAVSLTFTLRKPYISKDDTEFYILDNPVKREWVFKVPYVAPSQWKGTLRAAMIRMLIENLFSGELKENEFIQERLRLYRLFGNEKDGTAEFLNRALALKRVGPKPDNGNEDEIKRWEERFKKEIKQVEREFDEYLREKKYRIGDIEGFSGCLHFYPTFFDRIGLEVINPHPRDTGAGKNPIYFECVPAGTPGVFTLLYVPLDAGPKDENTVKADLAAVDRGIRAMLTKYGFGAKTSSGYGVADVEENGVKIQANGVADAREVFWNGWKEEN